MDSAIVGQLVAEQMEAIERDYGASTDHEIGAVITIVEVRSPTSSDLRVRHNLGGAPYGLVGYMRVAEERVMAMFRNAGAEPPEEQP